MTDRRLGGRKILIIGVIALLAIALGAIFLTQGKDSQKTSGNYADSDMKATASVEMAVKYKPNCEGQKNCDPNKQNYDFKVFVFDKVGRQVRVIRADDKGVFKASMPEGDYIMLVAKSFEGVGLPQEKVTLKNGKTLKLEENYGTETR